MKVRTTVGAMLLGATLVALLVFVWSFNRNAPNLFKENPAQFLPSTTDKNKPKGQNEVVTEKQPPIPYNRSRSEPIDISPPFSPSQIETAHRIINFIHTGDMEEIRALPRKDVEDLISVYLSEVPLNQVAESLEKHLGGPPSIFYSSGNPKDYLMDIFDVARGDVEKPQMPSNLIFTDSCATDGSVLGAVHIIPEGASTVYAVFENQSLLQEIGQVYAIWRNLNNDAMQFSEYEPLRVDSHYNYVWLKLDDGWKEGYYQLDLADPENPSRILASSKFKVRQLVEVKDEKQN